MYKILFKKILNPFYEKTVKHRNALKYMVFLEKSQWWPYERLKAYQLQELVNLLRHAYENLPFWRSQFDRLGIVPDKMISYDIFSRLPIMDKKMIRAHYEGLLASNYKGKTWKKSTGGSTGEPLHFEYTPDSYDWRVAISKRGYSWAGCEDGTKQAYIWGVAIGKTSRLSKIKEGLHHAILRQKYFNCFKFNEEEMRKTLRALNSYRPKIIVGYTNPLYGFAKFVAKSGKLQFKPKAIISAAEKLHDFQRNEISETFGCEVFNTYGSREFMLIASECKRHNGLHINMENLFVEILKEDGSPARPGETGEIVITDLHNYGMPFIRYRIGDMAVPSDKMCTCGRGLPLLQEITGRSLDMIKTPDGKSIPGEFFPHLMKEFHEVKKFQVIQDKIDHLIVKIVKNNNFTDARVATIKDEIRNVTGAKINVDVAFVDEIPLTATGKYRVTVSNI